MALEKHRQKKQIGKNPQDALAAAWVLQRKQR
jgi:hypothetical protein